MPSEVAIKSRRERYVSASDEERIEIINRDIWITCPRHQVIIKTIQNILHLKDVEPAPCVLVCGEGGFGKTALLAHLQSEMEMLAKVKFMSLANNPGMLKFNELVLSVLGVPMHPGRSSPRNMIPADLVKYVRNNNIKALIIDEFHTSLTATRLEQEKNLSFIKALSGAPYFLSIIALGTSIAKNALSVDQQLSRRYEIFELKKWKLDDEFRNFLASWENALPLKQDSNLYRDDIARALLGRSEGVMDFVVKGIKWAAIQAVLTKEEKITPSLIELGYETRYGYQ
ncbi:TniB family NTP-binding protein [Pseudomonas matsuisoli]|uniref:Transposase n=1 Tax=Pseudomonas matsuisoli TaxID=1515666 RepID=A0A917PP55_9PSED|nr:TniB family NTP-binding protein [Pseudomonas matsuisoli]GGJ86479.1 transposase [Pseudomonas matsuisoli]